MPDPPRVDRCFATLGDPVRRTILTVLTAGEQPASAIVEQVRAERTLSQPAVSQHLKVLREAGLVTVRADGTRRLYALDPDGIEQVRDWLAALIQPAATFDQPFDALATEVARGKRDRRRTAREQDAGTDGRGQLA